MCGFFLGDDFWIYFRVQRFLVRRWVQFLSVYGGFWYSDPAIDSRPALFITVYSALLGPQWYMLCVSLRNFMFFYMNRWITDPDVDFRLSGHVLRPLESDSHLFGASPEEYMKRIFLGDYFRNYFRMQCCWFDSGYMFSAS